jgi:predicted glycogen debranching enzyme
MEKDFLEKEWIHTNGIGGYASSTISGSNSRRYHGLLVASLNPPTDRRVLVNKIDEQIKLSSGEIILLGSNQYPNAVYPQGYSFIKEYKIFPYPVFTLEGEGFKIQKSIFHKRESNSVFIEYVNQGKETIEISLNTTFVNRDYHSMFHENESCNFYKAEVENGQHVIYAYYDSIPVYEKISKGKFEENRQWIKNVEYEEERKRGLDFNEDTYSIGSWIVSLKPKEKVVLSYSTDKNLYSFDPEKVKKEIVAYQKTITSTKNNTFFNDLLLSGDQFVVARNSTQSKTIIAGYHWFSDWGRDTMIAMRGLSIATGRQEEAKQILETFLKSLNQGMLPNRFPDNPNEEPEFNTVDATLWMFIVLYEYYEKFKDLELVKTNFNQLTEVIEYHLNGTRYNIHCTPEGFIYAGEGIAQLTWMDARIGDYVVTPRHGCPVEINVLWYNALKIYKQFSTLVNQSIDARITEIINHFSDNFKNYFLNSKGFLNDIVLPNISEDQSIRPNQIYALSLPFNILSAEDEKLVFKTVEEHLYTDLGLRTLAENHPDFKPFYEGGIWSRDGAYHQGTVWPFIFGEFWTAKYNISNAKEKEEVKKEFVKEVQTLKNHFYNENGLYAISEIFDGKNPKPNLGRGTMQQAWSVSNIIKVMIDFDLTGNKIEI